MRKKDILGLAALGALGVGFFLPARALSQDRAHKLKCSNNLRQLALGAIQYADDKRFFPHLSKISKLDNEGSTSPTGNEVPGRCIRALVFFSYHDNPESFVCPESDDKANTVTDATKTDLRRFGWGGVETDGVNPLFTAAPNDKDADKLTDLSYSWTVAGYNTNARSTSVISGDRARRPGAGATQKIQGNHRDGWNVCHVDGHTTFLKSGSDEAKLLASTAAEGMKLVCWDDSAAGGPAAEKPEVAADPAALAKAKKLLEAGGFEAGIKSDLSVAFAALRAKADNADAYAKWMAALKPEEAMEKVAAAFTRHLDVATLDAVAAFYESAAGKQVVQSQLALAKARKLSALTEPERLARHSLVRAGGPGPGMRAPREQDLVVFEMIGLTSAVYAKTLSIEHLDAAIAFYESPAGMKYSTSLAKATDEVADILRAWLEKKLQAPGSPFASVAREGNEAAAIGALKTLATCQAIFREGDKDQNNELDYGTLAQLAKAQLVDNVLGTGKKQGYVFECKPGKESPEFLWWATATPEKPGETGNRYFFMNQAGVIYYSDKPFASIDTKKCTVPEGAKPLGR